MNTIRLYGALAKEFGPSHRFDIHSPAEAFQPLAANFPRFTDLLRHGFYRVVIGKTQAKGVALDEHTIINHRIDDQDIHIIPVVKGKRRGGIGKVLAGILLVGLAMFGGPIMATTLGAGGSMTLGSVVGHVGICRQIEEQRAQAGGIIDKVQFGIWNRAAQTARQLAAEYGLTPTSRARIGSVAPGDTDDDDPLAV